MKKSILSGAFLVLTTFNLEAAELSEYECEILTRFKAQSFTEISNQHRLVTDLLSGVSLIVSRYVPDTVAREKFSELIDLSSPDYSYLNDTPLPDEQMISEYDQIVMDACPTIEQN